MSPRYPRRDTINTKHRHEWEVFGSAESDEVVAAECYCGLRIADHEIECRLNATEWLTEEHMKLIIGYVGGMEPLENYIRALGGKT